MGYTRKGSYRSQNWSSNKRKKIEKKLELKKKKIQNAYAELKQTMESETLFFGKENDMLDSERSKHVSKQLAPNPRRSS